MHATELVHIKIVLVYDTLLVVAKQVYLCVVLIPSYYIKILYGIAYNMQYIYSHPVVTKSYIAASQTHSTTRRSVEHCTLHADGTWLNELGWSQ